MRTTGFRLGDTRVVRDYVREVLERHRISLTPTDEKKLAHALLVENTLAMNTILDRASGTWRGDQPVKVSPTVSQVMAAYLKERQLPSKTEHEVRATFTRFKHARARRRGPADRERHAGAREAVSLRAARG